MSKRRDETMLRVKTQTQRAVMKIVGELMIETGEPKSADDAIQHLIKTFRPDLARELDKPIRAQGGKSEDGE